MTEKRHTIAVYPHSSLTTRNAFRAHCAALPHLGSCYGVTEQEALDRMAAVIDAASQSPERPGPTLTMPPPVGFVSRATHVAVVTENAKLRAEVERLRGVVAQCRGMADEGADAYLAAYRWCERIEEVCAAGEPLEEYEQWAWKPALREGGDNA